MGGSLSREYEFGGWSAGGVWSLVIMKRMRIRFAFVRLRPGPALRCEPLAIALHNHTCMEVHVAVFSIGQTLDQITEYEVSYRSNHPALCSNCTLTVFNCICMDLSECHTASQVAILSL